MSQQFVVPQFIDAEPKLLGPITPRQFAILFVTIMLGAVLKLLVPFGFFIAGCIPLAGVGLTVAFVKINGQAFHYFLLNVIQTMRKAKVRVWQKKLTDDYLRQFVHREEKKVEVKIAHKAFIQSSRLNELSLIVNTGGAYRPEADDDNA